MPDTCCFAMPGVHQEATLHTLYPCLDNYKNFKEHPWNSFVPVITHVIAAATMKSFLHFDPNTTRIIKKHEALCPEDMMENSVYVCLCVFRGRQGEARFRWTGAAERQVGESWSFEQNLWEDSKRKRRPHADRHREDAKNGRSGKDGSNSFLSFLHFFFFFLLRTILNSVSTFQTTSLTRTKDMKADKD